MAKRTKYFYVLFYHKVFDTTEYSHPCYKIFTYDKYEGQQTAILQINFQTDNKYGHRLSKMYGGTISDIRIDSNMDDVLRFLTKFRKESKEWYFSDNFARRMNAFLKRQKIERKVWVDHKAIPRNEAKYKKSCSTAHKS